jgi:hypothetical protein
LLEDLCKQNIRSIQAIRSKNQQGRPDVYFPLPLAATIGMKAGEEVQRELLDHGEIHLVRNQLPQAQATQAAEIPLSAPKPDCYRLKVRLHRQ